MMIMMIVLMMMMMMKTMMMITVPFPLSPQGPVPLRDTITPKK